MDQMVFAFWRSLSCIQVFVQGFRYVDACFAFQRRCLGVAFYSAICVFAISLVQSDAFLFLDGCHDTLSIGT